MESYADAVSEAYQAGIETRYGEARSTALEFALLYRLAKELKKGHVGVSWQEAVVDHIVEHGWPYPESVTAGDVGEAAIYHACVVAEHLAEERGPEGALATFISYTTKNQWDRFVSQNLPPSIQEQWREPLDRYSGHINPHVVYPKGVDSNSIYGIAKPSRYWPSQLMKNIEMIRLRKDASYRIAWRDLIPVINEAKDTLDLAVNVALHVARTFIERGKSIEEVSDVLVNGYDPTGPLLEHGPIPEISIIWSVLQLQLYRAQFDQAQGLALLTVEKASKRTKEAITQLNKMGNNYAYEFPNVLAEILSIKSGQAK